MIGKAFVLFKINSSPTAFYIIKPTCISSVVTKRATILKNCRNSANPKVYFLVPVPSDDVISWLNKNILLVCVESSVKINIWDVVSAV